MSAAVPAGFRLLFLGFFGPDKKPATLTFGPGLNVLYGASNAGKSFVVEAIDFMLGGGQPLRDISERVGYDRALLAIETLGGSRFTLQRSCAGGNFYLFDGIHDEPPGTDTPRRILDDKHNEKNTNNVSAFLLELCGLWGKRLRKNKSGDTQSLSFRNVARLVIVNEKEIVQDRSPLRDGNYVADTANFSTFKLLLTDIDDSSLVPSGKREPAELSREAQLELLDQLLDDHHERLKELTKASSQELTAQLEKLDAALKERAVLLNTTETEFQKAAGDRRALRKKLEELRDRDAEVASLLERFELLQRHYVSDIERLRGIEEGGTLFSVLGSSQCPLCGAAPEYHHLNGDCDGNIDEVVAAARREIAKIGALHGELHSTMDGLRREGASIDRRLPEVEKELQQISEAVELLVSTKLNEARKSYSELADRRGEVREALSLYGSVQDMERRRNALVDASDDDAGSAQISSDIPSSIVHSFAHTVRTILDDWHFPEPGDVFFDPKARDLVIAGKSRSAFGKGLRAITHAAFTIGLLAYCRQKQNPHTGFVVLDSPLLAYRKPEGEGDDLRGTDLQERFYGYLQALPADWQVIIVENVDPPAAIQNRPQIQMFSKNPNEGRFGLFPALSDSPQSTTPLGLASSLSETAR